jgi:ribosomal RNA-processing protein 1
MSVKKHKLRAAGEGERSGGHGPKRARKERPTVEALPATPAEAAPAVVAQTGESKFARALGSTDFHTREKGLAALTRWLAARDAVDDADLLKLWKGVFYCFWHSDKAPVQVHSPRKTPATASSP